MKLKKKKCQATQCISTLVLLIQPKSKEIGNHLLKKITKGEIKRIKTFILN